MSDSDASTNGSEADGRDAPAPEPRLFEIAAWCPHPMISYGSTSAVRKPSAASVNVGLLTTISLTNARISRSRN
jgi:hypothetical protein